MRKNYGNLSDERSEEFGKSTLRLIRFVSTRLDFRMVTITSTNHKNRSVLAE